jgi:hypothetical protein
MIFYLSLSPFFFCEISYSLLFQNHLFICGFATLFFAPCAFICITNGACVMGKDGDGTFVYFFIQN